MSEQTTAVAAPSAEATDVFRGENVSMAEYSQYRQSGELPERFKEAESAESAPAEEISEAAAATEPEGESDTPHKQQEKPVKGKQTAEERIAQLESTIEKIRKGAGIDTTQKAAPSPAQVQQPEPQYTRPKPTADDKGQDGNPKYETYEDFVEDLADWKAEQRWTTQQREQQQKAQQKELAAKVAEAKQRYGDNFDEVLAPAISAVVGDQAISPAVKSMLNESDVLPDLIYTIGSDPAELAKFIEMAQTNPGKAMRYIALVESGIAEELAAGKTDGAVRGENGQFAAKETPAKPKTSAPKPPTPVSGASTGAFDVSDESISPDEWMRKRNRQLGIK